MCCCPSDLYSITCKSLLSSEILSGIMSTLTAKITSIMFITVNDIPHILGQQQLFAFDGVQITAWVTFDVHPVLK